MSFANPPVLWGLLLLIPMAIMLQRSERRRRTLANRFVSERLRGRLLPARALRPSFLTIGAAALIVALAGPRFGAAEQTFEAPEAGLVILLDTSLSMEASDVGTSRLAASRAIVQQVLQRFDGRAGLVVFEGNAEVISPLTEDTVAIGSLLESVGAGELEIAGSNLRLAITAGLELLERSQMPSAAMLLISDGEHRAEELQDVMERARERNVPVVTVMVGTGEGSSIPLEDGAPLEVDGEVVVTRAREQILQSIAEATDGRFFANPFSREDLDRLTSSLAERAYVSHREARVVVPKNRYQIPLGIALGFFLIGSMLNRGTE